MNENSIPCHSELSLELNEEEMVEDARAKRIPLFVMLSDFERHEQNCIEARKQS